MSLTVTSREKRTGVFVTHPVGSLDTNTYTILEQRLDLILEVSPNVIVFDMEKLDYISSVGIRVILKANRSLKKHEGQVILINIQPQIEKVFDIIKVLPSQRIFTSVEELDDYLDYMQRTNTD